MMAEHLDHYESWLTANHRVHSPDEFRRWVSTGFQPGTPGREEWPFDPYPLVTVKKPDAKQPRLLGATVRRGHSSNFAANRGPLVEWKSRNHQETTCHAG